MDKAEKLDELGDIINDKGNSHNPEYWQAADIIKEAAERLCRGDSDVVDEVKSAIDKAMHDKGSRVVEPANNTIVAVLTDSADGIECNGCGEPKQMDRDGWCWSCRELYEKKPDN